MVFASSCTRSAQSPLKGREERPVSRIALLAPLPGGGHLAGFVVACDRKAIELVRQGLHLRNAADRVVAGHVHDPDSLGFGLQTYLYRARLLPKLGSRLSVDSFGNFLNRYESETAAAVAAVSE